MKALHNLYGKKLLPLPILLLLILSLLNALNVNITRVSAVESPYIAVVPDTINVAQGENFTVSIYTDYVGTWESLDYIHIYQFALSYNPSVLNGVEVVNGDLIVGEPPELHPKFIAGPFNDVTGELSLSMGYYDEPGEVTSGPGTLANVTFTVVGKGTSNITIDSHTRLIGWNDWVEPHDYDIINAAEQPDQIQHGYFDNRFQHDVAVGSVTAQAEAAVESLVSINVTVANIGKSSEDVEVAVSYDTTHIDSQNVALLEEESETVSFSWDTTGLAKGNYTINATATIEGDEDPTDNWKNTTFLVAHDVAVVSVTAPAKAAVGSLVPISVEVANEGSVAEVANVTIRYDSTLIGFNDTVELPAQNSTIAPFDWDTTGLAKGNYTINATATIEGDEDPTDNWKNTTIRLVAHDVAVVSVTALDKAAVESLVSISVEVANEGAFLAVANVTIRHGSTLIGFNDTVELPAQNSTIVRFDWDTTGLAKGNYTINATATIEGDEDPTDNYKTKPIRLVEHDVAAKSILVTPSTATPGDIVSINVTVANIGAYAEVANVTIRYDSTLIGFNDTVELPAQNSTIVRFEWNTTGLAQGFYTINATATIEGDEDPTDNWKNTTILIAKHDVTVKSIFAPTSVDVGELVTIGVLVENLGSYNETFEVKVTVSYDTTLIETQTKNVTLLPKIHPLEELLFLWNTTGVALGSYTITAKAILDGDVNPNNDLTTKSIVVNLPPGAIAGTVTDSSTGYPIEGANVTANGYSDTTDANGHYTISDVPAGTYNVTASANGYQTSSQTNITVDAGETTTVNFGFTLLLGTITGTVTDASTGGPIAGAKVTADDNSATTNANGTYTIHNVSPRDYTVTASAAKYVEQSKNVTLITGTTTTLDFELTPLNGTISGIVTDSSTGDPISEATVTANGMSATTTSSGHYTISDVPAGTYNVTASANGYQTSSQTNITVDAGETTTLDFELTPTQPLNILLYAGVAAAAIIIIAGIAVYILKVRKPT